MCIFLLSIYNTILTSVKKVWKGKNVKTNFAHFRVKFRELLKDIEGFKLFVISGFLLRIFP